MIFEAKLQARLLTLCPNVYGLKAPLDYHRPAVVWSTFDEEAVIDLDEEYSETMMTMQIAVYDTNLIEAKTIAKSIRTSLKAWDDDDVRFENMAKMPDSVDDTTETQLFKVMAMFVFRIASD